MKFKFGTKEDVSIKAAESTDAVEPQWLSAADSKSAELEPQAENVFRAQEAKPQEKEAAPRSFLSFLGSGTAALILLAGQLFMVAAASVSSGVLASAVFGQSYDRVLYHCGPQDTYMAVFAFAALSIYWNAWYFHKRRILKYLAFVVVGLPAMLLSGSLLPGPLELQVVLAFLSYGLLYIFQIAGSYFASFKVNWPRTFSVTRCLLLAYIPAIAVLAWEFAGTDFSETIDKVSLEQMLSSVGIISAFAFLPAFLTALMAKTKQSASAIGLAAIGQAPFIASMAVYALANLIMLACFFIFGGQSLAAYFAGTGGPYLNPDFDFVPTSFTELISKFVSSLLIFLTLSAGIVGGGAVGAFCNRRRAGS